MSQTPTLPPSPPRESLFERLWRFGRALIVGGGATIADQSVFLTAVHLLGIERSHARLPALLAGASVQFFGNRTFTFRAQRGRMSRQAWLFLALESLALLANWRAYCWLLPRLSRWMPPDLVSFVGTFAVFVAFSYPVRRLVIFRLRPEELRGAARDVPFAQAAEPASAPATAAAAANSPPNPAR